MIAIVENKDYVEAVFRHGSQAERYVKERPPEKNYKIRTVNFDNFPFYIVEIDRGKSLYFASKEKLTKYVNDLKIEDVVLGKSAIFNCNGNFEKREEPQFILNVIEEADVHDAKTGKKIGINHIHVNRSMVRDFQNENNLALAHHLI